MGGVDIVHAGRNRANSQGKHYPDRTYQKPDAGIQTNTTYTKIEYLEKELDISRSTAIRYLKELEKLHLVSKQKIGRDNFYINQPLFNLLAANK